MKTSAHSAARQIRRQRGFGLLESLICLSLMSLLFLGAMTLILTAARSTVRAQAQVYSTGDAANAIQNVVGQLREAADFSLPTSQTAGQPESNWAGIGSVTMDHFSTTMLNGETINTAIEIMTPPTLTPTDNGYTASPLPGGLNVLGTASGSYWEAGKVGSPWTSQPYNVQKNGGLGVNTVTLIYRGDPDGTPDSTAGTYLWQYTLPTPGGEFDLAHNPPTAICKSVGTAPNAVQFVRPSFAEQNQVEVKIISSHYSPINGQQTNEEGSGASSSALVGKCVYMRDHYTGGNAIPTNTGSRTGNDTFQYH